MARGVKKEDIFMKTKLCMSEPIWVSILLKPHFFAFGKAYQRVISNLVIKFCAIQISCRNTFRVKIFSTHNAKC